MDKVASFTTKNDQVRADVVAVADLPEYLENLPGREKHQYLPYQWDTHVEFGSLQTARVTHFLVLTWKGR